MPTPDPMLPALIFRYVPRAEEKPIVDPIFILAKKPEQEKTENPTDDFQHAFLATASADNYLTNQSSRVFVS